MFIYDTSKDSDGGAWTEKCQHTSWWNEPINGKWLGAQASETAARAVSGATTGDYFQRTTDGMFFRLNAGFGISETFRGNKRDFPRLAAIVAEASSVTIYDLTEPGRPMFTRFVSGSSNTFALGWANGGSTVGSLFALNGKLFIGSTSGNNVLADFAGDDVRLAYAGNVGHFLRNRQIANRNSIGGIYLTGGDGISLAAFQVNAVAMTVLPDAPVDPVTGLRVPTIAVATNGGLSIIKHNGVIVSGGFAAVDVTLSKDVLLSDGQSTNRISFALNPGQLDSGFTVTSLNPMLPSLINPSTVNNSQKFKQLGRAMFARAPAGRSAVNLARFAEGGPARSLVASVASTFNTGWMTGDVRRCFLSDTEVGSVTGPELVTNGTFDTDTTGWAAFNSATLSVVGGKLRVTSTQSNYGAAQTSVTTVVGQTYVLNLDISGTVNSSVQVGGPTYLAAAVRSGTFRVVFVATSTSTAITLLANTGAGTFVDFDNVSVQLSVADRSYRNAGASINGTLTRAQLASGTSLVGYSGFSAANYPREPYSADLDFGTGEWTGSAWLNIPTSVSASAVIFERAAASGASIRFGITATGQLTATAFDGTTTRTVTTSTAYNTATWLKARVNYTTDGTLAIMVNGREVAATRGAPLLTLNNPDAVLTIGNSFALDAPFPGTIALLKLSATVPTQEQASFMFEQEKQLFRENALSILPDSGALVDMAYDDATDRWVAISSTNESYWTGLVRNSVTPVPAGSYTRVVANSGIELLARSTTNPGVDISIPTYTLREDLNRRAEAASRNFKELVAVDYIGGFTASTTTGSTAITSVANITYPTSYIGARISGSGIPANTTITGVSGTTIYISAPATATATVSITFLDFRLPTGLEAETVTTAGSIRREGSTSDFTRLFDGFVETIRFATAPGATAWVQIQATRAVI